MALGRHWEWRGFGTISPDLRQRWSALDYALPDRQWHDVVDHYLWVPGYGVNVKMRSGPPIGDCLKFKRLRARWHELQLWHEDPEDVHRFPLPWSRLASFAAELQIKLPSPSRNPVGFEETLAILQEATPPVRVIEVRKHRLPRLWQHAGMEVLIEIAEISQPEQITSLCLESTLELTQWSGPDQMAAARDSVRAAVAGLNAEAEKLKVLNYIDALTMWADGRRLESSD